MATLYLIIDNILRITGSAAIIIGIIAFFTNRTEYIADVEIKRFRDIEMMQKIKEVNIYHEYVDSECPGEYTLFIPNSCRIKSVRVYSIVFRNNKLVNDICIKEFKELQPYHAILFNINYIETIPTRKIVWTSDYGLKGTHIFQEDLTTDNVDVLIYKYKYGLISKLRFKLGIK